MTAYMVAITVLVGLFAHSAFVRYSRAKRKNTYVTVRGFLVEWRTLCRWGASVRKDAKPLIPGRIRNVG